MDLQTIFYIIAIIAYFGYGIYKNYQKQQEEALKRAKQNQQQDLEQEVDPYNQETTEPNFEEIFGELLGYPKEEEKPQPPVPAPVPTPKPANKYEQPTFRQANSSEKPYKTEVPEDYFERTRKARQEKNKLKTADEIIRERRRKAQLQLEETANNSIGQEYDTDEFNLQEAVIMKAILDRPEY